MNTIAVALLFCLPTAIHAEAAGIKVSSVQFRDASDVKQNTNRICDYIKRLAGQGSKIIVFPECALTGYAGNDFRKMDSKPVIEAQNTIAKTCKEAGAWAIVGSPDWQNGKLFNTALVISDKGEIVERYNKVFLVEDWPEPGDHVSVFNIAGIKAGVIICHDERYPELVRLQVMKGANVIFYISHESGVNEAAKIVPYRAQIQARAVENTVWVVQSNAPANPDNSGSNGHSRIIQPDGNIVKEASVYEEEVITAIIDPSKGNGNLAKNSLSCEFLCKYWEEGLKVVQEK